MEELRRPLWRAPYFWLLTGFLVSRCLYFAAGLRFDVKPLRSFFQFADPLLLRTRLFETLFYLHTQPPGFNFLAGVMLKLFPDSYATALHLVYLACGLSLFFSLYELMRFLDVSPTVAATLTIVFLCSPGVVLFENLLMYEYPQMALLCGSAILFYRLLQGPDFARASAFFLCLAALAYIRALFHLGWLVLMVCFTVWLLRGQRRMVMAAAALPLALVVAIYAKNIPVTGSFTSSTWMGFNADTIALHQLTDDEHERLIKAGLLSQLGRLSAMLDITAYREFLTPTPPTGIPVLDQVNDSTGRVNYNNVAYLQLHPYYLRDAKAIVLHYPQAYARSVVTAWFTYFLPTGDFTFFGPNREHIAQFDRVFNVLFFGQWREASNRKDLRRIKEGGGAATLPLYTGLYLMVGLPLLFCWGLYRVWHERWSPQSALLVYILFQIAFITVLVNFLSSFENNRYRLPLDPFFVALLGVAIEQAMRIYKKRRELAFRRAPVTVLT